MMKRLVPVVVVLTVLGVLGVHEALAQRGLGQRGGGGSVWGSERFSRSDPCSVR